MWPIFTASGPATSIIPGRRRRRLLPEEQFDPAALSKLERAGTRWLQRPDGTWARWSYLGAEWVEEVPPQALAGVAGPARQDVIWTDASGTWEQTSDPPAVVQPSLPPFAHAPVEDSIDERSPGVREPVRAGEPVSQRPSFFEEFAVAAMAAAVGLFIAYLVRTALALVAEPIPVTVFVPWLWKTPEAQPGIAETVRGLLLLSVLLSAAWVGLRRVLLAYRMPALAAGLVSLALVAGLWLTGFLLGRPV